MGCTSAYTVIAKRCTPLRTIEELVKQLNVLAIKYPVDYPWVQAQLHDLKTLQDAGQSKARIFYHGATIKSGIVREVQDSQGSDHYSLLKHWKAVTNDHLEVYQWKDLQIQADNYFKWRTDPALSGIEDVLVDVAGGPALTFNQHPGGFIFRIKPHPLLEKARAEFNAVKAKGIPPFPPTTSLTRVDDEERSLRQSRIANCLKELSLFAQRYPKDFTSQHIARKDRLDAITKIASDFSVEGNNTIRAVVRDAIPLEVLLHPAKAYSDAEVGRGARNDYMVDEEAQGLVNPDTGAVTGEYRSTLFPMLDLFSVTIDHPNKWLPLFIAVLSTWLHILKPRYVSVCSSQIHKLALGGHFSSVFIEDKDLVKSALDSAFVDEKKPIDEDFLAGTIRHFLPWKNDTDISAPDSHPQKIVWPKLDTVDYIDWVGVVQVLPFGIDYRIVIPTYHGGSHAYIGCLRPHTIRLAQACEAVKALVEWATEGLHVDGTLAQANNIKHTIDKIAEKIGLDKVLESIRKDVKIRTRPLHSLKQLGSLNRAEPEQRQERAVRASSLMKQSITNYNQSTLKAVGRPGTAERLKQAMALLDINRQAINNGNTQVLPCPSNIAAGPGSCDFLEWMTFSVQEGKSYARTAQGASRLPTNAVKLEAVMTNQSVQRQREARARFADADSGTISVGDAKKELEKRKPVLLIKCSYCEMVAITKSEKAFKDRVRHACPNHKKELHDIDADQRKADGLKAVLEDPGPPSRSFDRPSHKQKLVQWSSDGKGGMWQTCADDQSVQAFSNTILNVSSSSKNKQRIQTLKPVRDRREKHGRLLLEDLIVLEKIRSYVRLKTILTQRSEANLPVPSSFTVVDVNTQI